MCSCTSIEVTNKYSELSSATLDALKDFYADRHAHQKQFEDLKAEIEDVSSTSAPLTMDAFTEDWNESQFWVRCVLALG